MSRAAQRRRVSNPEPRTPNPQPPTPNPFRCTLASMLRKLILLLTLCAGASFAQNRVFELRTYTCFEGKLDALKARFRDHTIEIFKRHGMESVGYWVPQDPEKSKNTLIYVLVHPSREAADQH